MAAQTNKIMKSFNIYKIIKEEKNHRHLNILFTFLALYSFWNTFSIIHLLNHLPSQSSTFSVTKAKLHCVSPLLKYFTKHLDILPNTQIFYQTLRDILPNTQIFYQTLRYFTNHSDILPKWWINTFASIYVTLTTIHLL